MATDTAYQTAYHAAKGRSEQAANKRYQQVIRRLRPGEQGEEKPMVTFKAGMFHYFDRDGY